MGVGVAYLHRLVGEKFADRSKAWAASTLQRALSIYWFAAAPIPAVCGAAAGFSTTLSWSLLSNCE